MVDTINEISTKEDEGNEFVKMCEKYSKEHVERINKCLSLKRKIVSNSRMGEDLKKMFNNNELFSDVTFKLRMTFFSELSFNNKIKYKLSKRIVNLLERSCVAYKNIPCHVNLKGNVFKRITFGWNIQRQEIERHEIGECL
jgi:hypothetical protein